MSESKSLKVTEDVHDGLNSLKIKLAATQGKRVPALTEVIAAMLIVSNRHYSELAREIQSR